MPGHAKPLHAVRLRGRQGGWRACLFAEPPGPVEVVAYLGHTDSVEPGCADVELYGMLCDGTVALGCTELDGDSPDSGDFDAQNGHTHDLVGDDGEVPVFVRLGFDVDADEPGVRV